MAASKPLTIFFSAGEPSGDLHGANLIRQLRSRCPDVRGRRLRRTADGRGRLPTARRSDRLGRDVVCPGVAESAQVLGPGEPGRSLFPPSSARRRGVDRLSGLQLVDCAAGEGPRHSRVLLHAAADLGLGPVAGEEDAASGRPRAVQSAVRGGVVPRAWLQRHVRRSSVLRRGPPLPLRRGVHRGASQPGGTAGGDSARLANPGSHPQSTLVSQGGGARAASGARRAVRHRQLSSRIRRKSPGRWSTRPALRRRSASEKRPN